MHSSVSGITKVNAAIIAIIIVAAGVAGLAFVGMQPQKAAPVPPPKPEQQYPAPAPAPAAPPKPAPDPRLETAKGEPGLLIYSSIDAEHFAIVQEAFEKKYPDFKGKITFTNMRPPEVYQRVSSELQGGKPTADMVIVTYESAATLQADQRFKVYKSKELAGFSPGLYDPNGEWASVVLLPVGISYNTQLVKKEDLPKNLLEFTDAKWRGKTAIHTMVGGTLGTQYIASLKGIVGDSNYKSFLDGLLTNVKPKPSTSVSGISADIAKGEIALGIATYLHETTALKEKGAPIEFYVPSDIPLFVTTSAIAILKTGKSPNLAEILEDYILSAEGQTVIGGISVRIPARSGLTGAKYSVESLVPGAKIQFFPAPDIVKNAKALADEFKKMGFG